MPKGYMPKGIIWNYNIIINGKKFYDQPIDSNIKRFEEIKKLQDKLKKQDKGRLYYRMFVK